MTPIKPQECVFLKIVSAVVIDGAIVKPGRVVGLKEADAKQLLTRGKAVVATEADLPAGEPEAPAAPEAPEAPAPTPTPTPTPAPEAPAPAADPADPVVPQPAPVRNDTKPAAKTAKAKK